MIRCDIIIPSCKSFEDGKRLIEDIRKTRLTEGNIIFTGMDASASINRNQGLNESNTDFIIMIDDDMKGFYWGWDIDLLRPLKTHSDVLITASRLMDRKGKPAYSMIENYDLTKPFHYSKKIPTACIAFRNTHVRFDEGFIGSGFEDDDFCRQMLEEYGYDKSFVTVNSCRLIHENERKNQSGIYWETNQAYFRRKWAAKGGKPIALCKAWCGNEFVTAAIESIYHHVDKIVFVHSKISWCGEQGNDVRTVVEEWAKAHDNEQKVINLDFTNQDQYKQYLHGIEYITKNFNNEFILFFDTDEVHEPEQLKGTIEFANERPEYNAFCMGMHTYIKSPFYRIDPPENLKPVVLYRVKSGAFLGCRGCATPNQVQVTSKFHHFTYVRKSEEALFTKIDNIYEAEKDAYGHVDLDVWKRDKWDKLPDAKDFHTAEGYQGNWKGIKIIELKDLPASTRELQIVREWINE